MSAFLKKLAALAALLLLVVQPVLSYKRYPSNFTQTLCSTQCFQSLCNATEINDCTCHDRTHDVVSCLYNTCLSQEYYIQYRLLYYKCDLPRPIDTVDPEYTITAIVFFVVQTLVFVPRITARLIGLGIWYKDDTACVTAYVLFIPILVLSILQGYYGCYVHQWDLDFEKVGPFFKVNFARSQLYAIVLGVTKASILFFYQRIFEGRNVKRVIWATHFYNLSVTLAYFITQFLVSQPLYCEWKLDQGPGECRYHDVFDGSGAYSAMNAALDLWMVAMAAFLIWKLQMKVTKRISVIAVFATGLFTFFTAVFRFIIWRLATEGPHETAFPSLTWATFYASGIEITACFIISCLPAIRQLADKKILPSSRRRSSMRGSRYKLGNTRSGITTAASWKLVINKTQETKITSSVLDDEARLWDDWNPDRELSRTSRQVNIR